MKLISFDSLPTNGQIVFDRVGAMTMGALTRTDIADALRREVGLSGIASGELVARILDVMGDALANGETVKFPGFGTFAVRNKGERIGRNPKTGVEVSIAPRRVLTFRASTKLRARIIDGA